MRIIGSVAGLMLAAVAGAEILAPCADHDVATRKHQGIPSIAVSEKGRFWATWYANSKTTAEDRHTYVILATSTNLNAATPWHEVLIVDPDGAGPLRAFDPQVWISPDGKLRLFWTERLHDKTLPKFLGHPDPTNDALMMLELDPDAEPEIAKIPAPRRVARGVMMGKPLVLADQSWALPLSNWFETNSTALYVSCDCGTNWVERGSTGFDKPVLRLYDECNLVQRRDGTLDFYLRSRASGIYKATSTDLGATWTRAQPSGINHTSSRSCFRRLRDGKLLLIKNGPIKSDASRRRMMAFLSTDDGATWQGGLEFDPRVDVSYPDVCEYKETIYVIYDRERTRVGEILVASFNEEAILKPLACAGHVESARVVSRFPRPAHKPETLYNGIRLPAEWPPRTVSREDPCPEPPYLEPANLPPVMPIDLGRQLFVDDFLVASTAGVVKTYHHPVKYAGNPILMPETAWEIHRPESSCALPKGGGLWWDSTRRVFRMWYEAGWCHSMAYAESADGIHWTRVEQEYVPGTNRMLPQQQMDSWSVVREPDAASGEPPWKLYVHNTTNPGKGDVYLSWDGLAWLAHRKTGLARDRSTMFYNPFRKVWVYSLRSYWSGRTRTYRETPDFYAGADWAWTKPETSNTADCVMWMGADRRDVQSAHTNENKKASLYNFDAVAYESIMLGAFEIHWGPENGVCETQGLPKICEIQLCYSRDGFHFSRPDRTAAIAAERWDAYGKAWDIGYVQPLSNICVVNGDELWFYYGAFGGDTSRLVRDGAKHDFGPGVTSFNGKLNGMYDHGCTGLAKLRRDGFASFDAAGQGEVVTRPVKFTGSQLFLNARAAGSIVVEVRDAKTGEAIPGFEAANCVGFTGDSTKRLVTWKGTATDLASLRRREVQFCFKLDRAELYSFWVSKDATGASGGYLAGGGPGYAGLRDL